eukprot:TRINITY_DN1941_c0_g1_i1.p1 TRINITY_DN1941_c0_g1~~TRINITY_DN1941_c0_g1_i1.p1  ORF type:complete len:817 (-),score=181.29 TRINITY_DN1941_c0_g1_i1:1811-4261(-)
MSRNISTLALALGLLAVTLPALADIRRYTAVDDARERRFLGLFSYCRTGHLRVDVLKFKSSTNQTTRVNLFIERFENLQDAQSFIEKPCPCRITGQPMVCPGPEYRNSFYAVLGDCAQKDDPARLCDRRRPGTNVYRNRTRFIKKDVPQDESGGAFGDDEWVDEYNVPDDFDIWGDDEFGDEGDSEGWGLTGDEDVEGVDPSDVGDAYFKPTLTAAQPCAIHPNATADIYFDGALMQATDLGAGAKIPKGSKRARAAAAAAGGDVSLGLSEAAEAAGFGVGHDDSGVFITLPGDASKGECGATGAPGSGSAKSADGSLRWTIEEEATCPGNRRRGLRAGATAEASANIGRAATTAGARLDDDVTLELANHYALLGPNPGYWALFLLNCPNDVCRSYNARNPRRPPALTYDIRVTSWNSAKPSPPPRRMRLKLATPDDSTVFSPGFKYLRGNDDASARRFTGCGHWPAVPLILFFTALTYAGLTAAWVWNMKQNWDAVRPVHMLVLLAVGLKLLSVLVHALRELGLAYTGTAVHLSRFWYFLHFLRMTVFFVLIVLLGTGWNTVKEYVTQNERRVITGILFLQVLINISFAIYDASYKDSRKGAEWRWALQVLEVLGCVAVLLPIFWAGRSMATAAAADGKAAQTLRHLYLFRFFYLVLLVWLYMTRIVVPLVAPSSTYLRQWVAPLLQELSTLAFVVAVGFAFRPVVAHGAYLSLGSHRRTPVTAQGFLAWLRRGGGPDRELQRAGAVGVGFARGAMDDDEDGTFLAESLQELETVEDRTARELADSAVERARDARAGHLMNSVAASASRTHEHRD